MTLDVSVNGRLWKIAIEPASGQAGTVVVTVDGRRRDLDVSWVDGDTLSLIEGGIAYEVRLQRRDDAGLGVEIGGRVYETVVQKWLREPFSTGTESKAPGAMSITAPMPGRIMRVLVASGDRVVARQGLVVVEAMKMENELRAPRAGIVKDVLVAPGATVESGAVLVVVE